MEERIVLTDEDGQEIVLYAVEETKIAGVNYLLAAEEEGDGECWILKDVAPADSPDAIYEVVEEESELEYLYHIFRELVEDIDIEL